MAGTGARAASRAPRPYPYSYVLHGFECEFAVSDDDLGHLCHRLRSEDLLLELLLCELVVSHPLDLLEQIIVKI